MTGTINESKWPVADNVETEVKLSVPDLDAISRRLQDADATLVKSRVRERNVRYDDAEGSFIPRGIVLRLREDDRIRLTYKEGATIKDDIVSRFEDEVEVSDFATMETILGKLGYHPYMVYEKYRTTYELYGAEIVLDEMPYGNFAEVEGDADTIERVLQKLGLADAPRHAASYADLFDNVCYHLKLDFRDLTFANFAGITVPDSAFLPRK